VVGLGLWCSMLFRNSHIGSHNPSHRIISNCATWPSGSFNPYWFIAWAHDLTNHPMTKWWSPTCIWSFVKCCNGGGTLCIFNIILVTNNTQSFQYKNTCFLLELRIV
jgi:hypothetical protein